MAAAAEAPKRRPVTANFAKGEVREIAKRIIPLTRALDGCQVIVTGGTSGVGKAIVEGLLRLGADVSFTYRDQKAGDAALQHFKNMKWTPFKEPNQEGMPEPSKLGAVQAFHLEAESFASVEAFAAEYEKLKKPLDGIVLNAGILGNPTRELTKDGFERVLQVNYLSQWLLLDKLLPFMRRRPAFEQGRLPRAYSPVGRVVLVSSQQHATADLDLEDLGLEKPGRYDPGLAYSNSKLCQMLLARKMNTLLAVNIPGQPLRRLAGAASFISLHPGNVNTEGMLKTTMPDSAKAKYQAMKEKIGLTVEEGAKGVLYAMMDPAAVALDDATTYLDPYNTEGRLEPVRYRASAPTDSMPAYPHDDAWSDEKMDALWDKTAALLGRTFTAHTDAARKGGPDEANRIYEGMPRPGAAKL